MKIFFDTEFTGLHKDTTLVSIGIVDENGRSFYAEFSDYDKDQCDDWIKENVIKHLYLGNYEHIEISDNHISVYGNKKFIKEKVEKWLSEYNEVNLISDCCHYDMVLFIDIFGSAFDLPKNVNPACHDINQDIAKKFSISEKEAFDLSREKIIENHNLFSGNSSNKIFITGDKHNSLYDAKVIKEIYNIIKY